MQKVVDYKLIQSTTPETLTETVVAAMAEGWVPSGIVVRFKDGLVQAMVKFEEA